MSETITDFIKQDLKARLGRDAGLPAKLTLTALAQHYQVSTTPVRLALRDLIDEQVLAKEDNGQLRLHPEMRTIAENDVDLPVRAFPASEVEQVLTQEILRASLSGHEDYLREEATADASASVARCFARCSVAGGQGTSAASAQPRLACTGTTKRNDRLLAGKKA